MDTKVNCVCGTDLNIQNDVSSGGNLLLLEVESCAYCTRDEGYEAEIKQLKMDLSISLREKRYYCSACGHMLIIEGQDLSDDGCTELRFHNCKHCLEVSRCLPRGEDSSHLKENNDMDKGSTYIKVSGIISKHLKDEMRGKSLRQCAEEVGVSHATLSRVFNGSMPDVLTLKSICEWTGVKPAYLLHIHEAESACIRGVAACEDKFIDIVKENIDKEKQLKDLDNLGNYVTSVIDHQEAKERSKDLEALEKLLNVVDLIVERLKGS